MWFWRNNLCFFSPQHNGKGYMYTDIDHIHCFRFHSYQWWNKHCAAIQNHGGHFDGGDREFCGGGSLASDHPGPPADGHCSSVVSPCPSGLLPPSPTLVLSPAHRDQQGNSRCCSGIIRNFYLKTPFIVKKISRLYTFKKSCNHLKIEGETFDLKIWNIFWTTGNQKTTNLKIQLR